MSLSEQSRAKLQGIHPDLVKVVDRAATQGDINFVVTEGLRTRARQRDLFVHGATTTMKSRHLTGHAVDLAVVVAGEVRWDWPLYVGLGAAIKNAAAEVGVPIEWGGDWRTFKDGPHFQLPWHEYPADAVA